LFELLCVYVCVCVCARACTRVCEKEKCQTIYIKISKEQEQTGQTTATSGQMAQIPFIILFFTQNLFQYFLDVNYHQ